jgi:hypothetical protein
MKKMQPVGPYQVGGYSTGVLLAMEVVRMLEEAGDKVDTLFFLIDHIPYSKKVKTDELSELAKFISLTLDGGTNSSFEMDLNAIKGLNEAEIWEKIRETFIRYEAVSETVRSKDIQQAFQIYQTNVFTKKQMWESGFSGKLKCDLMILSTEVIESSVFTDITEGQILPVSWKKGKGSVSLSPQLQMLMETLTQNSNKELMR